MSNVVGGLMALVALASSIFKGIEPTNCLIRGVVAFFVGSAFAKVWYGLVGINTTPITKKVKDNKKDSVKDPVDNLEKDNNNGKNHTEAENDNNIKEKSYSETIEKAS